MKEILIYIFISWTAQMLIRFYIFKISFSNNKLRGGFNLGQHGNSNTFNERKWWCLKQMGRFLTKRWKPYLFSIETFPYNFKKLLFSFSFFSSYGFQESTLISTRKPKLRRKQLLATARENTGGGLSDYTESDCSNKTSRSSLRSCGSRTLCKRSAL